MYEWVFCLCDCYLEVNSHFIYNRSWMITLFPVTQTSCIVHLSIKVISLCFFFKAYSLSWKLSSDNAVSWYECFQSFKHLTLYTYLLKSYLSLFLHKWHLVYHHDYQVIMLLHDVDVSSHWKTPHPGHAQPGTKYASLHLQISKTKGYFRNSYIQKIVMNYCIMTWIQM